MSDKYFFDVINERFSCRSFKEDKISDDELNKLLEAARLAPTACNFQPQRIYVVEDSKLLDELKTATRFLFDAKTVLCVCHDKNESWKRRSDNKDHGTIDASIAATQIALCATSLGLGTCFVCAFKDEIVRNVLEIPDNYEVLCLLPVGYPKEIKSHNERKDIKDFVIYR